METSGKLGCCRPLWRTYDGGSGGTRAEPFDLLDEELGKFVDVDVS